MGAIVNTKYVLPAAVADAATFTMPYPAGYAQADLNGTTGGVLVIDQQAWKQGATPGVGFTFGAGNITVTNSTGAAFASGKEITVSFGRVDIAGSYNLTNPRKTQDKVNSLA